MAKTVAYKHAWQALSIARIMLAFVFLWAFFDKLLGLGIATGADKSWLSGASPTSGFLMGASQGTGPLASWFGSLAGQAWVDWLFMFGLLGIGTALLFGIGLRIAAAAGTLLLGLMWFASQPLENNPFVDDHAVYIAVLWAIAFGRREWSLTDWWLKQGKVKKNPWLW